MDDRNQIPSQNQTNVQVQSQTQALQDQKQPQSQQQSQGGGSVGSLVKEHGPTATGRAGVLELVKPSGSETEPELHRELEKIGVSTVREFPKVGPEEQKIGIKPAGASVPVKTEPTGLVQTPMTEKEARQTLKNAKPTESVWGLAAEVVKFFKKIRHKLLTRRN